jgi:hypothetical protein
MPAGEQPPIRGTDDVLAPPISCLAPVPRDSSSFPPRPPGEESAAAQAANRRAAARACRTILAPTTIPGVPVTSPCARDTESPTFARAPSSPRSARRSPPPARMPSAWCTSRVQSDHVHLLLEGDSREALIRGIQGLAIRCARAINRAARRTGSVWSDRYHSHVLTTPRETRRALAMCSSTTASTSAPPRASTRAAPPRGSTAGAIAPSVSRKRKQRPLPPAHGLLSTGWRRAGGAISFCETPHLAAARARSVGGDRQLAEVPRRRRVGSVARHHRVARRHLGYLLGRQGEDDPPEVGGIGVATETHGGASDG